MLILVPEDGDAKSGHHETPMMPLPFGELRGGKGSPVAFTGESSIFPILALSVWQIVPWRGEDWAA